MGMDVLGLNPTTKQGKYFRNSIWWWHPLASYVCVVAPEIADHCEYWQTNDGDGLNARDRAALRSLLFKRAHCPPRHSIACQGYNTHSLASYGERRGLTLCTALFATVHRTIACSSERDPGQHQDAAAPAGYQLGRMTSRSRIGCDAQRA